MSKKKKIEPVEAPKATPKKASAPVQKKPAAPKIGDAVTIENTSRFQQFQYTTGLTIPVGAEVKTIYDEWVEAYSKAGVVKII